MTLDGGDLVLPQWCFLALLLVWGKALISSASHPFLSLCLPCLHYTLYISYLVVSLRVQEQNSNPLQGHNCTFHLQLVSTSAPISCQYDMTTVITREPDHQSCCLYWEKHLLIHGLATAVVNGIENSLGSVSFQFILFSWWKLFMSSVLHHSVHCHLWACKNKWWYCTRPYHIQLWTLL